MAAFRADQYVHTERHTKLSLHRYLPTHISLCPTRHAVQIFALHTDDHTSSQRGLGMLFLNFKYHCSGLCLNSSTQSCCVTSLQRPDKSSVMKYDLGEVWDSLGLLGVLSSTVGWRHFNILISFRIKISSNCGKKKRRNQSLAASSLCGLIT